MWLLFKYNFRVIPKSLTVQKEKKLTLRKIFKLGTTVLETFPQYCRKVPTLVKSASRTQLKNISNVVAL
jgi:hypothetical protein